MNYAGLNSVIYKIQNNFYVTYLIKVKTIQFQKATP